jgi:hypothetical protein
MEEPHPGDHPTAAGEPTTAGGDPPTVVGDPPTTASLGQDTRASQAHTPVDLGLATAAAQRTTPAGQGLDMAALGMAAAPEVQAALGLDAGCPTHDAAEGLDAPAEAPMSSALALARSLLPTVPHPAVEYNLPVLDAQR